MRLSKNQIKELIEENASHKCDGIGPEKVCVRIAAIADLPTRFGDFQIVAFYNNLDDKEHAAIIKGDVTDAEDVHVRVHSECLTGDAFGSMRCDCRDQLQESLKAISKMDKGIVLYLRQEGRGIGLTNKIQAYGLQDHGYDTVDANLALGFRDDERDYSIAAHMLTALKVKSIQLMTNNPRKIKQLTEYGIKITKRIPHVIPPNEHNRFYLETKAHKSGHLIDFQNKERQEKKNDYPVIHGMNESIAIHIQTQQRE